jgi:O-methyltransferase
MQPNGKLVLVETFLGRVGEKIRDDIADTQGAIIDLHMFVVVGGRERSVSQYEDLLRQANLYLTV